MQGDETFAANGQWTTYGTTPAMWAEYGIDRTFHTCPSATHGQYPAVPTYTDAFWGNRYMVQYMWIVNLWKAREAGWAVRNWGKMVPALPTETDGERLLAADAVYWGGGVGWGWGDEYRANHAGQERLKPAYQNLLFVDGRVEGKPASYYPDYINTVSNFSFRVDPAGAFNYWGQ